MCALRRDEPGCAGDADAVVVAADDQNPPVTENGRRRGSERGADTPGGSEPGRGGVVDLHTGAAAGDQYASRREADDGVGQLEPALGHGADATEAAGPRGTPLGARIPAGEVATVRSADDECAPPASGTAACLYRFVVIAGPRAKRPFRPS